ncbi:hypothetical protein [Azospirillum brasilense]|uniref:hypothetical protein n=1 Tax=Azospirillum brasilense TaxID=192 RepID=UPI000E6885C1|nr:hypothetical protein [Azospirillum brasilense]NUB28531.1 hypothetical protein [Azospirillum brasilense]NUB35698.1 hypothetical protein [Azospirillum brasilense]RIV96732.1 hypothetical protein D2T81_30755 [Azospirillum brasilense]
MSGFYLMHRGWLDHPAFGGAREPYCRRAAWAWLVENAKWRDEVEMICGKRITLRRGQLSFALRFLASAWGWDVPKVRRFIARLHEERMVEISTDTVQNVITICNYDEYQLQENATDTRPTLDRHSTRSVTDTNLNEENKGIKEESVRALPGDALPDLAEQGVVTLPANDNPPEPAKQTKRGTRVPDGDLPDDWAQAANHTREKHQMPLLTKRVLGLRWENFRNYWTDLPGSKGLKRDWKATWLNDCISPVTERKFPAGQPPPSNANAPPQAKRQASSLSEIPLFFDTPTEV